jgi:hypothetical protein
MPVRKPYKIDIGGNIFNGRVEYLTEENVSRVSTCCVPGGRSGCMAGNG